MLPEAVMSFHKPLSFSGLLRIAHINKIEELYTFMHIGREWDDHKQ